jgi:hypothetical protein
MCKQYSRPNRWNITRHWKVWVPNIILLTWRPNSLLWNWALDIFKTLKIHSIVLKLWVGLHTKWVCITNLLILLVHSQFARNLLFHGFVFFAHKCHASKTCVISSYLYVHHTCFKHTTFVHKTHELMKKQFSHDFHYQIVWWEICDVISNTRIYIRVDIWI